MATIVSTKMMNIVEAQKREGYTSQAEFLAELAKRNDLLQFAPWYVSNNGSFHKWLKAVRLGKGAFTKINGPVPTISSTSDEFVEPIAFYQADSLVDDTLLKGAKDKQATRDSEDVANTQGFMNDWLTQVIYNTDIKDGFAGFAQRRGEIDNETVFTGGGTTGDQSSLYLIEFGKEGFNFRYAPGMVPGISTEDRGRHYIDVPVGAGKMWAWIRHFEISGGMEIKNDKALQRMCNIPVAGDSLPHATFIKMKNKLPNLGRDSVAFANRTIHAIVETLAYEKSNAAYSIQDIEGFGPVTRFVGIPVMFMEAITDSESVISS